MSRQERFNDPENCALSPRVFIVDDGSQQRNSQVAYSVLRGAGIEVLPIRESAVNTPDLISLFEGLPYDEKPNLIIYFGSAIEAEPIGFRNFMKQIKDQAIDLPVIAISGRDSGLTKQRAINAGASSYIRFENDLKGLATLESLVRASSEPRLEELSHSAAD